MCIPSDYHWPCCGISHLNVCYVFLRRKVTRSKTNHQYQFIAVSRPLDIRDYCQNYRRPIFPIHIFGVSRFVGNSVPSCPGPIGPEPFHLPISKYVLYHCRSGIWCPLKLFSETGVSTANGVLSIPFFLAPALEFAHLAAMPIVLK